MRTALTPDAVIDAAVALVERDGADQLTMRKLAGELGVAANSIYWHVGGREELLDAVITRVAERYGEIEVDGRTPKERVRSVARHIWRDSQANRQVLVLAHDRGHTATISLPLQLALAREISASGLSGADSARALRGILYSIGGLLVMAFRPLGKEQPTEARWAEADVPDLDPALVAAMRSTPDLDDVFEHTIGALVEAFIP